MLLRKSATGMAVAPDSRRHVARTILLKTCSSKFWVPRRTNWLNDVCASQFAWAKPVITNNAASFASDGGLIMTSGGNANGHAAVSKAVCMLVRNQ